MKTAKIIFATLLLLTLFTIPTAVYAHTSAKAVILDGATIGPNPTPQAPCVQALFGAAEQENLLFCISDVETEGSLAYKAAINAANASPHVIVGTPLYATQSTDWGGNPITYVEFSSGLHMEFHGDGLVRIYNTLNQQVYCC